MRPGGCGCGDSLPDDADLLVALDADPEVMRYITYGLPTPRSAYVETYLPRWLAIYQAQPGLGYFAAERRDTGEFLGWFHLRDDRIEPEYVELGYRFRRSAWGRGYATEGARALLAHGFNGLGLARISARTLLGNLRLAARDGKMRLAASRRIRLRPGRHRWPRARQSVRP